VRAAYAYGRFWRREVISGDNLRAAKMSKKRKKRPVGITVTVHSIARLWLRWDQMGPADAHSTVNHGGLPVQLPVEMKYLAGRCHWIAASALGGDWRTGNR
jgi:hypothetical protein